MDDEIAKFDELICILDDSLTPFSLDQMAEYIVNVRKTKFWFLHPFVDEFEDVFIDNDWDLAEALLDLKPEEREVLIKTFGTNCS